MKRLIPFILATLLLATSTLFLIDSWSYRAENNPIEYKNLPFKLDKTTYRPGETIVFSLTRCNNHKKDISYSFTQAFVNTQTLRVYTLPSADVLARPGCVSARSVPKTIPKSMPNGTYKIEFAIVVRAQEGLRKDHTSRIETERFNIVSKIAEKPLRPQGKDITSEPAPSSTAERQPAPTSPQPQPFCLPLKLICL